MAIVREPTAELIRGRPTLVVGAGPQLVDQAVLGKVFGVDLSRQPIAVVSSGFELFDVTVLRQEFCQRARCAVFPGIGRGSQCSERLVDSSFTGEQAGQWLPGARLTRRERTTEKAFRVAGTQPPFGVVGEPELGVSPHAAPTMKEVRG